MTQLGPFMRVALAGVLGACGGDSTGTGPQAASVTGIAGDNQSAPTGSVLSFPLSFIALDAGGHPVQGVSVTWSASPTGAAAFSPSTATTDVNGSTATNVTVGTTIGNLTLSAAVTGVPNVVFHATVVDPCGYVAPYTFGQTINGTLTTADCRRAVGPGAVFFYDFHGLTLPAGQQNVRISMHGSFDGWVDFWEGPGLDLYIAFDDDSILGAQPNPQLDIILPGGAYVIGASSFNTNTTGTYSLSATTRVSAMNGCRQVWVTSGITVTDSITLADCGDSSAITRYYDVARIVVFDTTVLTISQRSATINPSLALYKVVPDSAYVRHLVAANDDSSATNTNAFIQYEVDTANVYDIILGTSVGGQTGPYTFSVDLSARLSPRFPAPRPSAPPRWWQRRPGELFVRSSGLRGSKL